MELKQHSGWTGVFTTEQAPGCYRNGTRIVKVLSLPGDAHNPGTQGTVLGSMSHPHAGTAYFVEWDPHPRYAIFVEARKIRPVG